MKKIILSALFMFGIISLCSGQTNLYYQDKNIISYDEFTGISFNGITLGQIMQTKGNPAKVNALFGTTMQFVKSKDSTSYYWINFGSPTISFTFDELVTSPADLSGLDVDSKLVSIKIGNAVFHIGDPITMLGDVKILTRTDGSKSIVFLSEDADDQWVSIEFDQVTKLITKVEYRTI